MLVLCHPQRDNRSYAGLSRPCIAAWAVHDDCDAFATDTRCDLPQPMRCAERPSPAGSPTRAALCGLVEAGTGCVHAGERRLAWSPVLAGFWLSCGHSACEPLGAPNTQVGVRPLQPTVPTEERGRRVLYPV